MSVQKITVLGTSPRITYECKNVKIHPLVNGNIATNEREVDHWKSEVMTFGD